MNLQVFITSGILELYVHGLASPEEIREVEAMAEQHPEIQQEINTIRQTLAAYTSLHSVEPPADLKEKILQRLNDSPYGNRPEGKPSSDNMPPLTSRSNHQASGRSDSNNNPVTPWFLGLALLGACLITYLFWQKANTASDQFKSAQDQLEAQRKQCEDEKTRASVVNEQFIAIRHWATKPAQLKATALGGDAFAVVYWNNVKKTALLDVVKLPEPPADKHFQLWAIVNGKPADMGVIDIAAADSLQEVPYVDGPQAFAVTLEPKGGSESPTMDQMYVVGKVAKG